ncbi:LytTR family DNA-binding domain-containing protein [Paenibacillus sp. FSL L8-0436]|uniref:LytR/AlgR family response regulator transcription factor n=1 Tax=Paenibacillus sp. FSL L8-0436 TaxID=2954686 RepID=UPI0031598B73
MINIAVCDDDINEIARLQKMFARLAVCSSFDIQIHYFTSGKELLRKYKEHTPSTFQVLCLDIEMPDINGIELAQEIRNSPDFDVQIIFLTSYPAYILDSLDTQPFQYLIKPVLYEFFESKMFKLLNYLYSQSKKYLTIKIEGEDFFFRYSEIIAIQKSKKVIGRDYMEIITTAKDYYTTKGILSEIQTKLEFPFLQVHRSVLINLDHLRKLTASSVIMINDSEFPLSRSKSKLVKEALARNLVMGLKDNV